MDDISDEELTLPWHAAAECLGVTGRFSIDAGGVSFSGSEGDDGWHVPSEMIEQVVLGDWESDSLLISVNDDVLAVRFMEHDHQPFAFVLLIDMLQRQARQEAGTAGTEEVDPYEPVTISCSICGDPFETLRGATWGGYPNLVCGECSSKALNLNGEPATPGGDFDHGDNPVFIYEIKCWRRYHFGGCVTMRDVYDCDTLDEFWERHVGERP